MLRHQLLQRSIRLPTLAERREDILVIAQSLLEHHGASTRQVVEGFEPEAERGLVAHSWPGNLRELEDVVVRSIVYSRGSACASNPSLLKGGMSLGSYRLLGEVGARRHG